LKFTLWIAGGEAKSQADVESGLIGSFTSATSKLDTEGPMLSPFLTDRASEEVRGAFLLLSGHTKILASTN
jgi:hypothetical protein